MLIKTTRVPILAADALLAQVNGGRVPLPATPPLVLLALGVPGLPRA